VKRVHLTIVVLVGCFFGAGPRSGFGQSADTIWTGNAANGLWGDAGNWSNGVPLANGSAQISTPDAIDLGGVSRQVGFLLRTDGATIQNGGLQTSAIYGCCYTIAPSTTLSGAGGTLLLWGLGGETRIEGPIVGDGFDLHASAVFSGENTYTGRTVTVGDVTVRGSGAIRNSPVMELVDGRVVLDNREVNSPDRLNDQMDVQIWGPPLRVVGNAGSPTFECVGSISFMTSGGGVELVQPSVGGPGIRLEVGELRREPGTIGAIDLNPAAGQGMFFDHAPFAVGGGNGVVGEAVVVPGLIGPYQSAGGWRTSLVT
jgi:hypothetical protein